MNKLVAVVAFFVLIAVGFGGWYFFMKKSPEDGFCVNASRCETGLKCSNKVCSSGKLNSSCGAKADCQTGYCVNSKCSDGKKSSSCATYKDCETGLLCQRSICSIPPDHTKYFSSVTISKMKAGLPPGPNNPLTATTEFKSGESIEIDFVGVKPTTNGTFKYEVVNSTTGEIAVDSQGRGEVPDFAGHDFGSGTDLSIPVGQYDLNLYLNDELVYTTPIKVN